MIRRSQQWNLKLRLGVRNLIELAGIQGSQDIGKVQPNTFLENVATSDSSELVRKRPCRAKAKAKPAAERKQIDLSVRALIGV